MENDATASAGGDRSNLSSSGRAAAKSEVPMSDRERRAMKHVCWAKSNTGNELHLKVRECRPDADWKWLEHQGYHSQDIHKNKLPAIRCGKPLFPPNQGRDSHRSPVMQSCPLSRRTLHQTNPESRLSLIIKWEFPQRMRYGSQYNPITPSAITTRHTEDFSNFSITCRYFILGPPHPFVLCFQLKKT